MQQESKSLCPELNVWFSFNYIKGIISMAEQEEDHDDYKSSSEADKERITKLFYI